MAYGPVTQVVEAPASVTPKAQITVNATAGGSIAQLMVADGQHVTAGQTLLKIDSGILDNYATHNHPAVKHGSAKHPASSSTSLRPPARG